MPRNAEKGGAAAWVRRWWRALISEACATALLVGLGLAAAVPLAPAGAEGPPSAPPLTHVALAFGFVVTGCCVAFGPASGAHMNPSVSLAAALSGRLPWAAALAYVVAQCVGAVLGFAVLKCTLLSAHSTLGVTAPAQDVGALAAAAVEAATTGLLALACCGAWAAHDARREDTAMPVKLGLLVAGLVYAGGAATGASLNPARSLAPALLHGVWDHHWVYWVGPLAGAALAALLHTYVIAPRPAAAAPLTPEDVPLDDKP